MILLIRRFVCAHQDIIFSVTGESADFLALMVNINQIGLQVLYFKKWYAWIALLEHILGVLDQPSVLSVRLERTPLALVRRLWTIV
jgi:hypothetical protein